MMMWMVFGAALGMAIAILINDYNVGLCIGLAIAAICCGGDLLWKASHNKHPTRLGWFD
jgi:uncharacterized membrane protein YjjB (DUF3815 family)